MSIPHKKKVLISWVIIFVSLVFCFPVMFLIGRYTNVVEISFFDCLLSDADEFFGLPFESLQNIYLTIFTCFVGIYFTVLGIMMANLKVAFVDFFKFSCELDFVLFSVSIVCQFLEVVFILPLFPYIVLTEVLIYLFIFCLLVFIVFAVLKMSVLQNYEKCLALFVKKAKKSDEAKIKDFYNSFVCKCFPDKTIDILDDFFMRVRTNEKE